MTDEVLQPQNYREVAQRLHDLAQVRAGGEISDQDFADKVADELRGLAGEQITGTLQQFASLADNIQADGLVSVERIERLIGALLELAQVDEQRLAEFRELLS